MSISLGYTFFDRAVADPIWKLPWRIFFERYPRAQASSSHFATAYNGTLRETSSNRSEEEVFARMAETKTLRVGY